MTQLRSSSIPATAVVCAVLGLACLLVPGHRAQAAVGDGVLLLHWSGSAITGTSVVLLGPAGGNESASLTPADSAGPPSQHRFAPVPAGVVRLERRNAQGELQQIWDIPLAAELTTVADLDLDADSLWIDPVHPDPFGNFETMHKTECDLLPGSGPEGALNMDTRPRMPGDANLDGGMPRLAPHLDPRPYALEGRAVAVQVPLSTPSPYADNSAPLLLTHGVNTSGGSIRAGGGVGGQSFGTVQKDFRGILPVLGRVDFSGAVQGETDQDSGPLGIASSELPNNKLTEVETQATAFFRPAAGGLARLDFYAYGQERHHFLQEFLQDTEHNPREDRADLTASGAYDFHAGRVGLSVQAALTRTVNKTGDGQAFDDLSEYVSGPSNTTNEGAVTPNGLYWSGIRLSDLTAPHLYNYLTQDVTTVRQFGAEASVPWPVDQPMRLGIQGEWATYRWYENLDPIDTAAGDPTALQNYASYLGYSSDGTSYVNSGPNGAPHPRAFAAYASQRLQVGTLALEGGVRLESFSSGEQPVRNPADPSNGGTRPASGVPDLAAEVTRTGVDPRVGLYYPMGSTGLWIDGGTSRENPPLEALYYSPNVLLHQAGLAYGDGLPPSFRDLISGNPSLKPEVTSSAQLGFYRRVRPTISVRVSASVADTRDTWAVAQYHANGVATDPNSALNYYENRGERREGGIHVGIIARRSDRSRLRVSYDLSQTETNVVEPAPLYRNWLIPGAPNQGSTGGEFAPMVPIWVDQTNQTSFFPSLFDHRHRLSLSWLTNLGPDAGGALLAPLLANADVAFTMEAASGAPYTPTSSYETGQILGADTQLPFTPGPQPRDTNGNGVIDHSEINTYRMPWSWQLDVSYRRQFHVGSGKISLRVEGRNLTDQKNPLVVYGYSGKADDDGWLSGNAGGVTSDFAAAYQDRVNNPLNFGEGRSVRASLSYDF